MKRDTTKWFKTNNKHNISSAKKDFQIFCTYFICFFSLFCKFFEVLKKPASQNFLWLFWCGLVIYTLTILQALFCLCNRTPPTVLKLGPWNFKRSSPMVWGYTAREDFWIPPPQPAQGLKSCLKSRSGGPSAYFTAFFAKCMLLGMARESYLPFISFQIWPPPTSSRLKKVFPE